MAVTVGLFVVVVVIVGPL